MCFSDTRLIRPYASRWLRQGILILLTALIFSLCACSASSGKKDTLPSQSDYASAMAFMAEVAEKARPTTVDIGKSSPTLPTAVSGISARSAVLIRGDTGEVLFQQNQGTRLPMASTTKIMTALVAVDSLPLDTPVCITSESVGVEGSSIYLTEGEILSLEELLYALLLESANDAATAIAVACAGSVDAFADLMNQKAAKLGLTDTHFVNPHGLDDPQHYTTAYELALIAKAAVSHPLLRTIMATPKTTISHGGEAGIRLLVNHNKLLRSYEGAIGVKTGFTKKSGRCLVSAAERDGLTLIAVTLSAPDDWQDHTAMLDYGFSLFEQVELCRVGEYQQPLWVVGGTSEYVMVKNKEGLSLPLYKGYRDVTCVVELPLFTYADITQDQPMGALVYYALAPDGSRVKLGQVPLYAAYGVERVTYAKSMGDWLKSLF